MSANTFTSCTGPYTRVPFARKELKPTQDMIEELTRINASVTVRERPSGHGGTDDFNLHIDIEAPGAPGAPGTVWDVRAAKFLGPKKMFARGHVYEIAIRKRDQHNTVIWEGYRFSDKFPPLVQRFPRDLQHLMGGGSADGWMPPDRAQKARIHLCTGA